MVTVHCCQGCQRPMMIMTDDVVGGSAIPAAFCPPCYYALICLFKKFGITTIEAYKEASDIYHAFVWEYSRYWYQHWTPLHESIPEDGEGAKQWVNYDLHYCIERLIQDTSE